MEAANGTTALAPVGDARRCCGRDVAGVGGGEAGDAAGSSPDRRGGLRGPERDVRDVVTVIMRTNQIGAGRLRPGQRLLMPAEYAAEASGMR
jgi:hypothetical protein